MAMSETIAGICKEFWSYL